MTPETFFQGRLAGWGVARSPLGRILRRFTIEMVGEWSQAHDALHLDETYAYIDGPIHRRQWAIHTDEQGRIIGHDAVEMARMRGRRIDTDFEIIFDRPKRPGADFNSVTQIVRFVEVTPDQSLMLGKALRLGLTVATIHVALRRMG